MAEEATDPFGAARANVRETVKWLTAALAGIAAIVVGTSPFIDLASLESARLGLALLAAVMGLAAILIAIVLALRLLVVPPFFFGDIAGTHLETFINKHAHDLLPVGVATFKDFCDARENLFAALAASTGNPATLAGLAAQQAIFERIVTRLLSVCFYEQLRQQFEQSKVWLIALSVVGIVALISFAFIANPPKAAHTPEVKVTCQTAPGATPSSPAQTP